MIVNCLKCSKLSMPPRQPLLPTLCQGTHGRRLQLIFLSWSESLYLLVTDYFSRYIEVQSPTCTTSASIIQSLKCTFTRHGLLTIVMSDNGCNIALKSSPASPRTISLSKWPAALTTHRLMAWLSMQFGPSRVCYRNQLTHTSPCWHTGAHLSFGVASVLRNFWWNTTYVQPSLRSLGSCLVQEVFVSRCVTL